MKKLLKSKWLFLSIPVIFLFFLYKGNHIANANSVDSIKNENFVYSEKIVSHYNKQLDTGLDVYGPEKTAFWMASLNTDTGKYPEDPSRPLHIPQRAYLDRSVDAPNGSTLYWDMPSIVVAYNLSKLTEDDKYADAADRYIKAFLEKCVAKNGVFLWGNHYYYDAFIDSAVKFKVDPDAVNMETETGDLHEIRPLLPAWDMFWKISPQATELEIRASTEGHMVDKSTGEFNRHADGQSGHSFLEAGGSLIYNLAWLYQKTSDTELLDLADKIADFNYTKSHPSTGLLANDPSSNRWDNYTSTTEIGLWAGCLLKTAQMADEPFRQKWISMADKALSSWLQYGYDSQKEQYYGMLNVDNGKPIFREAGDDYPYKPGDYSDVWEPLFPTHNYPMTMAESSLMLYEITGKNIYKEAVDRWARIVEKSLLARNGAGAYAEHYGRVIHFLLNCNETYNDNYYHQLAIKVAEEAVATLFADDMFRSHPGENRYDAVDGLGILSLSLIWLETGEKPDMMGLYF